MTALRRILTAAVVSCALLHTGTASAQSKDCGPNGCPATQQNDPQGQQPPQTLGTIQVTGKRIEPPPPTTSLSVISYGGSAGARPDLFRSNNYSTTTNDKKDRSNHNCKDQAGDPIEISTTTKIESLVLFQLPGEMGLRFELDYTSIGGWHDNLDYELDPTCGGSDQCYFTTLRRPDGSTVTFHGSYAGIYQGHTEVGGGGLATLDHNADGTYVVHDEDGTSQTYDQYARLIGIKDESGVGWTLSYGSNSIRVTDAGGRYFTIASQYNSSTRKDTVTVTDPAGHAYQFVSSSAIGNYGQINSLTLPGSPATVIGYTYSNYYWLAEVDYNGVPYSYTTFDSVGRATGTHLADGSEATSIVYTFPSSGKMTAAITNPLGHTTTNQYTQFVDPSGAGQQYMLASSSESALSDCGASVETEAYDSNGNPTKTVDNDGITHTYSYAVNGQLQTETEAYGTAVARKTDYVWDPTQQLNRLLSVTVEGNSKTSYTYNAQNRLASVTRTNLTGVGTANESLTTTYSYTLYGSGIVASMTVTQPSPNGSDHTTFAYDTYGNLTSVTDGLGHVATYSNYNGLGEVGKIVGPNGDETDYTYDARGRIATKTTHPNGTTATWTYAYDGFGLLSQVSAPDGEVTMWSRDAEMRVKTISHNDMNGTSTETFTYDANNDVTLDVIARGSDVGKSTSYVYDGLGRIYQVKGSHGQVLTYAYDGNGNVLSVTNALGYTTHYVYDALNRLASTTNAANGVTSYAYDAGDRVTRTTDPRGLVTSYAWDGLGQFWQQVSPDTGTTNFSFDSYGRLASKTRADGTQITYAYDALNRLTSETAGGVTRAYTWDVCTDGKGRLCAASNQGYDSVGYSYSPEGWITGRSFSISGGPTYGLGYAYDNMGHLAVVDYPDGNQALYDYTDGAVADVRMKVGTYSITGVSGITYRPMDLAMSNWTSYNGLNNTISYDSDLRPTAISVPNTESLAFTYDAADRITYIANGMNNGNSQSLGYDALNRLTSVNSTAENESYSYDADGNRTSMVVNGSSVAFSMAPDSNRLITVGGATFGYDANGNTLTVNGNTLYQYGPFNRLANANGIAYRTSAEDQRIFKSGTPGTTYFAPDTGGTLMAEYDPNGVWLDYIWLNGKLVTVVTSNGGVYPVHDDQTGRPIAMTNLGNQSVIWAAQNLPFTRNVTTSTWFSFNLGFPGQYQDAEDGIWHNGNRDYNAYLGRYIESDPIGLAGGINTYAYVGNNPISNIDPLGLCPCTRAQQAAANAAKVLADEAVGFGTVAAGADAISAADALASVALGRPSALVDAGAVGFVGNVAGRATMMSAFTSAALNTYASGPQSFGSAMRYFGGFAIGQLGAVVAQLTGVKGIPGGAQVAKFAGDLAASAMALAPPAPCQQQ